MLDLSLDDALSTFALVVTFAGLLWIGHRADCRARRREEAEREANALSLR